MKERWIWLVRYAVVIVLALVLAAALGEMDLFKTTKFGKSGLNAARLVQFLGFGSALAVLWLAAQRAAALLPAGDERWNVLKSILYQEVLENAPARVGRLDNPSSNLRVAKLVSRHGYGQNGAWKPAWC